MPIFDHSAIFHCLCGHGVSRSKPFSSTGVNVLAEYDVAIHSPSFEMPVPSVIALKEYVPPAKRPAFTRFNVYRCATGLTASIAAIVSHHTT